MAAITPCIEDNIRVVCRVRPLLVTPVQLAVETPSSQALIAGGQTFGFDYVAPTSATQEQLFDETAKPIADACLAGFNGTVFAYGQTGSGKTYTVHGPMDSVSTSNAQSGLLPRTLDYVFARIKEMEKAGDGKVSYISKASFLEIYNERVYDLIDASGGVASGGDSLQIREHKVKGVFVEGLTESAVCNAEEAHALVLRGMKSRSVGATAMNSDSSRSHSVFTLLIESSEKDGRVTKCRTARFCLIDLAGSERQKVTQAAGDRLKEAGQINKSLSALGGVISALVDIAAGRQRHVHYRDSKLTLLLRDSLGGNSRTVLIATVSPTPDCVAETLSTLRFAARAKLVKNKAVVNEDSTGSVAALQAELRVLRSQVAEYRSLVALPGSGGAGQRASVGGKAGAGASSASSAMDVEGHARAPYSYSLADSILGAWDSVMAEAVHKVTGTPPAGRSAPGFDASTALAALKQMHEQMGRLGSGADGSLTLGLAASAYERLVEAENGFVDALKNTEDRDAIISQLQGVVASARDEAGSWKAAADCASSASAALAEQWARMQAAEAAVEGDTRMAEEEDKENGKEKDGAIGAIAGPTARGVDTKFGFSGMRRGSVSSTTGSVAMGSSLRRPSISVGPPTVSRRNSVSVSMPQPPPVVSASHKSSAGGATKVQAGATRRPSISTGGSGMTVGSRATGSAPAAASATLVQAVPANVSLSPRAEFAAMVETWTTALVAAAAASQTTADAALKAEVESLRLALGARRATEVGCTSDSDKTVIIRASTFNVLMSERSALTAEVNSLRELVAVADPAAALKNAQVHADMAQAQLQASSEAEYEAITRLRAKLMEETEALRAASEEEAESVRLEMATIEAELSGERETAEELRALLVSTREEAACTLNGRVATITAQYEEQLTGALRAAKEDAAHAQAAAFAQGEATALAESSLASTTLSLRAALTRAERAEARVEEAEAGYERARALIQGAQAEAVEAEAKVEAALAQAASAMSLKANLEARVSSFEQLVEKARFEADGLALDVERSGQELRRRTNEHDMTTAQLEETQAQVERLQSELLGNVAALADYDAAQGAITSLTAELEGSKSTITDLTAELEGSKSTVTDLTAELEGSKSTITDLTAELEGSKSTITDLTAELEGSKSTITGLTAELEGSKGTITDLTAELEGSKSTITDLTAELEGSKSTITSLTAELEGSKSTVEPTAPAPVHAALAPRAHVLHASGVALPGMGLGSAAFSDTPLAAILAARRAKVDGATAAAGDMGSVASAPTLAAGVLGLSKAGERELRGQKRGPGVRDANARANGEGTVTPMTKRFHSARGLLAEVGMGGPLPTMCMLSGAANIGDSEALPSMAREATVNTSISEADEEQ